MRQLFKEDFKLSTIWGGSVWGHPNTIFTESQKQIKGVSMEKKKKKNLLCTNTSPILLSQSDGS